jgi:protein gp37
VFCASLADVWDNKVPAEWRAELFELICQTPHLDWLLLTKRPGNIEKMLVRATLHLRPWPWPNVWLGTTAEDQEHYDRRWPVLETIPAAIRFISYEPALGPLKLGNHESMPDWLICGGETGAGARVMKKRWARKLLEECEASNVPFFMKQMTNKERIPDGLLVRQFPKSAVA